MQFNIIENDFNYPRFLEILLEANYEFITFKSNPERLGQIILRHDIDFDLKYALGMAEIENIYGVKSSYFIMLTSENYNLNTSESRKIIKKIEGLIHDIQLHFDPTQYNDLLFGFESKLFENITGRCFDLISFHRPGQEIVNGKIDIEFNHTCAKKYSRDIHYYSDSRGSFRYS